jgi:hypothetical protein
MNGEPLPTLTPADISDRDLMLQFESLGDNCELGLVQRRVDAEPLGLLRFAGAPLPNLLRAMAARFAGLADPSHVRIQPENGVYMVKLTKYDFIYHADAEVGKADPNALLRQQLRILPFLVDKLLAELENPSKILVFRQNEPLLAADLVDLRLALDRFGPSTLLWVQSARPGHPPGTVARVADRLLVGYVSRLALRESAPDLDLASWLIMLRNAYALHRAHAVPPDAAVVVPVPVPESPSAITLRFGIEGNAQGSTGAGWSAPENGFTWAIGDRSLVSLNLPSPAAGYWLEMDLAPYIAPPALPSQRLEVRINGEAVHVFDPLPSGKVACAVPGRVLSGKAGVEIVLEHPRAASPRDVSGANDGRRLAVAFRSLALSGIAAG